MLDMSSTPTPTSPEQPHIVSLVLKSKKALQHGEILCSRASTLSNASAQYAVDVLALDSKVKWITDAILEQLKLAANVAKSIEKKQADIARQAKEWDTQRTQRADALDNILESLGLQFVPPDFHQTSSDSSPFGSQHSGDEEMVNGSNVNKQQSPKPTLLNGLKRRIREDRSKWKSLRDFVDERAIEDVLETMENDRTSLDDVLATTVDYPQMISEHILTIQESLPHAGSSPSIESILLSQDKVSTEMAHHLESLAAHYDQMASALRDSQAGELFGDEDIQEMNRDTEELRSIIAELEDNVFSIESLHEQLLTAKSQAQDQVAMHRGTLDDLDELADIMTGMLQRQESVEVDCADRMEHLQAHLMTIEDLHHKYTSYQFSYNKLLIEIARRRQYREAADNIVRGMMAQLEAMTEEERLVRQDFNTERGQYLPSDLCLCIENPPTRWEIIPWNGEPEEVLPDIDNDILVEAKDRLTGSETGMAGSQSL